MYVYLTLNSDAGSVGQSEGVDSVPSCPRFLESVFLAGQPLALPQTPKCLLESQVVNAEIPPGAGHSFPSFPFEHTATEKVIIKNSYH